MGILDKLKNALFSGDADTTDTGSKNEFDTIITDSKAEGARRHMYFWNINVGDISYYKDTVACWTDKKKLDFIAYLIKKIDDFDRLGKTWSSDSAEHDNNHIREGYIKQILKSRITLDPDDVERLQHAFTVFKTSKHGTILSWPLGLLLNRLEIQYKESGVPKKIIHSLTALKAEMEKVKMSGVEKEKLKLIEKTDTLIFKAQNTDDSFKPTFFLGDDDFSVYANKIVEALPDDEKKIWYPLIAKAQKATGSKPSKKYLEETKSIFKELGTDKFKKVVNDWFSFVIQLKDKTQEHTYVYNNRTHIHRTTEFLSAINVEAIKGFVWMCSHFHDATTIFTIAKLAERAYTKIPEKGPAAASIGNACLFTLYKSKGLDGIGQLSRLRLRIKQSSTQKLIEKYLEEAAKEQGVSLHEIEDLAVDDGGLIDGKKETEFDDYKAEIKITGVGKSELNWYKPDGSIQKSVPAFVQEKYAPKLKKIKASAKQIDQTTSAQRDRIDRMFRANRKWSMDKFNTHYMHHGLMSFLAKKIIWVFTSGGENRSAINIDNQWINNDNQPVFPDNNSEVSLWHPATESVAEIKKWREFLIERQIQQPLKQAFREVYLLTDAEVRTKSYSNRMAAHILKQHQYVMLAKGRNWSSRLMGGWDGGDQDIAELKIPEYKLKAQFWVQSVEVDGAMNETGIWNYVSTDQIRFTKTDTNEVIDLVDVPPVPFSEVLRDVDLFVGVASVGNDAAWRDSGGMPGFRDYWTSYSFGDLSEVAKNRKEILTSLVPRLKISKAAEIKDKFLVVKGKLRTYKIHIGSTNILMEPNDQYLCIVPDRSQKSHTDNLFIPFEGDAGLSIILSKAFLLANDDKITDTTITSQINRN